MATDKNFVIKNGLTINGSEVITSAGNLTNIGTISSGAITATGNSIFTGSSSSGNAFEVKRGSDSATAFRVLNTGEVLVQNNYFYVNASQGSYFDNAVRFRGTISNDTGTNVTFGQAVNVNAAIKVSGTTVIDSSRNLTNIGTISSGAITSTGAIQGTSFSDGTISGITFIDEDSFATNSATRVPTQQSIKAYVDAQVAGVVDSAPATLDTLNELAAALGDDANFSTTTSTALGNRLRVDTAAQGLTGTQQANAITNLGITATKAELNYVDGVTSNIQTQLDAKLASSSYTAADVLAKIKTVDGAGSGLDADLLDGISSASFLRSDADDTTSGNITITKTNPTIILNDNNISTSSYPAIQFDTSNAQGVRLEHNEFDGELPVAGYGLVLKESSNNTQFPSTGTLSFSVLGEMYAGATSIGSLNRVFHDAYHPNADTLTTARTISLGGDLSGSASFDGSANITITATVADDSHNHTYFDVSGITDLNSVSGASNTRFRPFVSNFQASNRSGSNYNGGFEVGTGAANYASQLVFEANAATTIPKYRHKISGTWGAWQNIFADSYHPNADAWTTARTITLGGDLSGNVSIDGSANVTLTATVADDSHNHVISNVDGLQTALDAKLDSSSYTAADVLTKIKTVDGAGSGLDADLLDGISSASFLRSDATDTASGALTFSGAVTFDQGTNTLVTISSGDTGAAGLVVRGDSQGTGYIEVGQSSTYGGGMFYNGDGSPAFAGGETADHIGFYRLSNGTRTEVFHYSQNSNDVNFNGNITLSGTVDGRDVASDGTKLDTIATNADVTPSWVPSSDPSYATQSYVGTQISNLVDSAPSTLDTLNELAAALGDDANFSTTVTNSIATKLPLAGGTMTGNLNMSGASIYPATDNTGQVGNSTYTWNFGHFTNFQIDDTLTVRSYIDLADSDGIRWGSSDDYRMFYNGTTNYMNFEMEAANLGLVYTDNGTTRFTFLKSGRLGIGTPSPNYKLEVDDAVKFDGPIRASTGSAEAPAYTFHSDNTLGMFRNPNVLGFAVAGTERMRINTSGIEVTGSIVVNGTIKLDGNYPTGTENVALGDTALDSVSTGARNTAIGTNAGTAISSGTDNTAVGMNALASVSTGTTNTAVGRNSLYSNTGNANTALGYYSLFANTSGTQNVAIGAAALDANTTANENTAIGYASLSTNTTGAKNTAVGESALYSNTTGAYNTAVGENALNLNTTASFNTAVGREALGVNTTGASNTALGYATLISNTTASNNTAVGHNAMVANTTGGDNVSVGADSLRTNTTGGANSAFGKYALYSNTTANYNVAVGYNALYANTTGFESVAVGVFALDANTTGERNVAVGYAALSANTTGIYNTALGRAALNANTTASYNTAVGYAALDVNTTASYNTAVGYAALTVATTGTKNVAFGSGAGEATTTGSYNVFVGDSAGYDATDANNNVFIGFETRNDNAGTSNQVVIGHQARSQGSGKFTVGTSTTTYSHLTIGGTSWSGSSDERLKKEIADSTAGLSFINDLRPVTFKWKTKGEVDSSLPHYIEGSNTPVIGDSDTNSLTKHGFIAQEVKAVLDNHPEVKEGADIWEQNRDEIQNFAPTALIPMLVKSIQELSAKCDSLQSEINILKGE